MEAIVKNLHAPERQEKPKTTKYNLSKKMMQKDLVNLLYRTKLWSAAELSSCLLKTSEGRREEGKDIDKEEDRRNLVLS